MFPHCGDIGKKVRSYHSELDGSNAASVSKKYWFKITTCQKDKIAQRQRPRTLAETISQLPSRTGANEESKISKKKTTEQQQEKKVADENAEVPKEDKEDSKQESN